MADNGCLRSENCEGKNGLGNCISNADVKVTIF
jgi:hypothetical protein